MSGWLNGLHADASLDDLPGDGWRRLRLIRAGQATTRTEIGTLTGLSRTAVAARVSSLQASGGLVVEREEGVSTGGRPPVKLSFHVQAGVVLSAAIGRSRTQLAICDLAGDVIVSEDVEQEIGTSPAELMPVIAQRLIALRESLGETAGRTVGIGISLPRDRRHRTRVQPELPP